MEKRIIAWSGITIYVDTSDKACLEFGFKSGDKVIWNGVKGTVEGVASSFGHSSESEPVLWLTFVDNNNKSTYLDKRDCRRLKPA